MHRESRVNTETLNTKYGKINRVPHFKYLGEFIESIGERVSQYNRLQKTKKGPGMVQICITRNPCQGTSNTASTNTIIKPTFLYACETLTLNKKYEPEGIKKEERKIIREILGPKQIGPMHIDCNRTKPLKQFRT